MFIERPLIVAAVLVVTFVSACTIPTAGTPNAADSIEVTLDPAPSADEKPRPSSPPLSPAPRPHSSSPSTPTPEDADAGQVRALAERYIETVNNNDEPAMAELNCAQRAGLLQVAAAGRPVALTDKLERAPVEDRYYVGLLIGNEPAPNLTIERKNQTWCVRD